MNLATLTDIDLVDQIRSNPEKSSDALTELSHRHTPLFHSIFQKYVPHFVNSGVQPDDLIGEKWHILFNTARKYDRNKAQFNTYFGTQVRFFFRTQIHKLKNITPLYNLDDFKHLDNVAENQDFSPNEFDFFESHKEKIFAILKRQKNKKLFKVIYMRFFSPKPMNSFHNISLKLKISAAKVSEYYHQAMEILKNADLTYK